MAYLRTTSETKTDVNLLVEIDVNAYNEIEVDIKRSGLCVLDESLTSDRCGLSGNGPDEGCAINIGNNTGFRSVVKRSLTLEKEVSCLKWREEYLTICEDGSVRNAQTPRTAAASSMKNEEGSKQCLNDIKNKPKYVRENSGIPQKSKDYKGMYLVANSNMSYAQQTQEAAFYMETQGNNDFSNCVQGFQESDSPPDEFYKNKTGASFVLPSKPEEMEEATMRTSKKQGPNLLSENMHHLHPVSYPQSHYTNEGDVKNALNDVMAKSVMIEEIGKKLIQFLGSTIGQKLMMEYSNGKQESDIDSSLENLLNSTFSMDMDRIKMIVDEICNALQTQSSEMVDEDSSKLRHNPKKRIAVNKCCPKECFLTEVSTQPANNIEEQYISRKEYSGTVLNKSEQKIHNLNLKKSNRLHRNRYKTENYKGKSNILVSDKQDISVNSNEARNGGNCSAPSAKMNSEKKSIFTTVKETFNAFLKNKLFENCTEKHVFSIHNKVEHQSNRVQGRSDILKNQQRGEYPHTGAKYKNDSTSVDRGSHLSTRKLKTVSKQTVTATHKNFLQKSENLIPEYGISKSRKKSQMSYSAASPKSEKIKKWTKDDFQKLLFELLEKLCSKIKKKDLQRLSVLLDILMKLQDQNLPSKEQTGKCTEIVACYNIKQHTKEYTRQSKMRQLHTVSSNKQNVPDASVEEELYKVCKAFFKTRNSDSATKYEKCIQTNLADNSEILTTKNSVNKQEQTELVTNTNQSKSVQTDIQAENDTVLKSNMWSSNMHIQEDLEVPLNHIINKKNNNYKDSAQFIENHGEETMVGDENQNISGSRKLLSDCRARHRRQFDPDNNNLITKEVKTMNNFSSLMRSSNANQSYNCLNTSVVGWQGTDGHIKCPIYQRESECEYSHEPAPNLDKIDKFVTIMGLSEAYELYNNLTSSAVCLRRTDSKIKNSEKQIYSHIHKTAGVSSPLYQHTAFRHDSSNVAINEVNGVGVKINVPFPNEVIFPKTTECYKKNLKTGKTLKFYLPVRFKNNNYMEFSASESENKEARHHFENEEDKLVTDDTEEEINLIKEECVRQRNYAPNPYLLASNECFMLHKALLCNVMMEHPMSNEQQIAVCESVDCKKSTCNEVEPHGALHDASSIFLIESTAGKQATHTNNCYSFQHIHRPQNPWKSEEQVSSFMLGAYSKRKFPVESSLCIEDGLYNLGDHTSNLPETNLVPSCDVKAFDIKIIGEHDQKVPNSMKAIRKQIPTYFVFSAHDIKTNKEKMHSHITRKTKKRNRIIHNPQASTSNGPQIVDNYASYLQRPSICLEPTTCFHDPASHLAMEHLDADSHINLERSPQNNNKNNNIQNKRAKKNKVLHHHDFHTSNLPPRLEERRPFYSSKVFREDVDVNVIPEESVSNTVSHHVKKSLDKDNHINLNAHPSGTDKKFGADDKFTEENNALHKNDLNAPQLPFKLDERKLCSSSVDLGDDRSEHKIPIESITSSPAQQSVESLVKNDDMKSNTSSSDINQVQNIDRDSLRHNDFHAPHFPSKLEAEKSIPRSVKFQNEQRGHVYPVETSSSSEELVDIKQQESDYFPAKKSKSKHNIFSSESEQQDQEVQSGNEKLVLPQKYGEQLSNKMNIKSFERIKMLSQIDANDMAEQGVSEVAIKLNDVPGHLVSENCERDQHYSVSVKPQNSAECIVFPSTFVNKGEPLVPKDSFLLITKSKDVNDQPSVSNVDDSPSIQSKKQRKVSKIIQKIFPQKNNNDESKEILSSLGANTDLQSFPSSDQFGNTEQQEKNMKQVNFPNLKNERDAEKTTPRPTGAEYDKWRLSQSRKLLKTHHALIKEAHDLGPSASEVGDSDGGSTDEDKSQKTIIGQSTWNSCTAADFLLYFRRGFRDDQMTLNNKVCFVERMDLISSDQENMEEMVDLMITCHPLDFLVRLGYSAEEAALISQDEEIKCRLYAAIREARIWANAITKPQAALLYLLAHKAKPKIMRYYLCLVESIINRRLTNAVKLNELIDFLECLEDGEIALKDIFEEMAQSEAQEEKKKTEDLYTVFHHMAEEEAMNCGKYPLSAKQIFLLQTLVSKYHIALQDHLALLTRYIGRGLIKNTVQLEAALVYLPHVGRHSVNIHEFEQYCGIKPIETKKRGKS